MKSWERTVAVAVGQLRSNRPRCNAVSIAAGCLAASCCCWVAHPAITPRATENVSTIHFACMGPPLPVLLSARRCYLLHVQCGNNPPSQRPDKRPQGSPESSAKVPGNLGSALGIERAPRCLGGDSRSAGACDQPTPTAALRTV